MRILVSVALWPVRMALTVLEWAVLFMTHFVGIGCYLMSGFCFLVAVTGWSMGLAQVEETVRTLGVGVGFFCIPMAGNWMTCTIGKINQLISQ